MSIYEILMKIRHEELLREAEHSRLIYEAKRGTAKEERIYCRILVWFGEQLYRWGYTLVQRYGASRMTAEALSTDSCIRS